MRGSLAMPYFRTSAPALSSAMKRFTVLFEMGRSGTTSLLSPSIFVLCFDLKSYTLSESLLVYIFVHGVAFFLVYAFNSSHIVATQSCLLLL